MKEETFYNELLAYLYKTFVMAKPEREELDVIPVPDKEKHQIKNRQITLMDFQL